MVELDVDFIETIWWLKNEFYDNSSSRYFWKLIKYFENLFEYTNLILTLKLSHMKMT